MSDNRSGGLGASRTLLRALRVLNLAVGAMLVMSLLASYAYEPFFVDFFTRRPPRIEPGLLMPGLRIWMVAGFPMIAAVHVLLSQLLSIVETVRGGDPFVPDNVARMNTIAWCVLVIQLLHLMNGVFAAILSAAGSNFDWNFSPTGWVAVVLLFVLARVFEEGTRIRADLKAMV